MNEFLHTVRSRILLMILSLRAALERWPRQLRFFVLMLALLTWVAPTWHVCELGGHVMSCASDSSSGSSHHGEYQQAETKRSGERGPLICYCDPREGESKSSEHHGPVLTASPSEGAHNTCLALLLQGMPAVVAHSTVLTHEFISQPIEFEAHTQSFSPRHIHFARGRAPPVDL